MNIGLDAQLLVTGVTLGAAGVAIYVKLSLPDYTIRVLNGRYPTASLMEARFKDLENRVDTLKVAIEDRLDTILCVDCPHVGLRPDINGKEKSLD